MLIGLLVAFLSLWLVASAVYRKKDMPVSAIDVVVQPLPDGTLLINEADVRKTCKQIFGFSLEGKKLVELDIDRLERGLERVPFVHNAEAWIDAAHTLHVRIVQRQPILRIIDAQGVSYYIDEQGVKMPLSPNVTAHVPVATGFIPPFVPDFLERRGHVLGHLFRLVKAMKEDALLGLLLGQLYVRNGGEVVLVTTLGDFQVWLGDEQQMEDELERLRLFYEQVLAYKGWHEYDRIDLRYRNQIVCKKR